MNVFKRKVLRYTQLHARRRYQIFHGDSRQQISYKNAGFGVNYLADVLITDPPYCLLTRRRKYWDIRDSSRRTRKLDDQEVVPKFESVKEYREFTNQWLSTAMSALKPSAFLIVWTNFLGKEPIIKTAESLGYTKVDKEYLWCKHSSPRVRYKDCLTDFLGLRNCDNRLSVIFCKNYFKLEFGRMNGRHRQQRDKHCTSPYI